MVTTWPKNFPGLGTGAETFANMVNEASGGRINITVFGAGEIVPAFEAMDAVSSGAIEIGHGGPYYWKGKVEAAQYLSAIPFGLTPQEQNSWFEKGGGQELADERDSSITKQSPEEIKEISHSNTTLSKEIKEGQLIYEQ